MESGSASACSVWRYGSIRSSSACSRSDSSVARLTSSAGSVPQVEEPVGPGFRVVDELPRRIERTLELAVVHDSLEVKRPRLRRGPFLSFEQRQQRLPAHRQP